MSNAITILVCMIGLFLIPQKMALANDWSGFYDKPVLVERLKITTPDLRAIFELDIGRRLSENQLKRLAGTRIEFPLEDSAHPMNFYADNGIVILPVSSIQFARDIVLAYSWLSANNYDLQPVTDYLVMIRYQWPSLRNKPHVPLELLGVPVDAMDDAKVAGRFQHLFGTMMVFVMGHELGHVYYRHHDRNPKNETESDQFGLALLENYGAMPIGVGLFFHIMSHLDPFPGDPHYAGQESSATHPLSPDRLQAVIDNIRKNSQRLALQQTGRAENPLADYVVGQLELVRSVLSDRDVQRQLRNIGRSVTPDQLRPRRITHAP